MSSQRIAAVATALLGLAVAGCGGNAPAQPGQPTRPALSSVPSTPGPPTTPSSSRESSAQAATRWPERVVLREIATEAISQQVYDPAAASVYELISTSKSAIQGPWILRRTDVTTRSVTAGPTFTVGSLAIASGYLWIYGTPGPGSQPMISQVNPATLAVVRSVSVPAEPANAGVPSQSVAAGPDGSVWVASFQTLLRLNPSTGRVLAQLRLPAGLAVSDISADPAHGTLYVSAGRLVSGGAEGDVLLEYDARSGRLLATASGGLVSDSVVGAALTAVPGGVWASFRTGMLGLTIHLGRQALRMIAPPGPDVAQQPADSVFHWPMYAVTSYGGGALWVANQTGIVACLDPATGRIRDSERVSQSQLINQLLAADPATHTIFAVSDGGLLQITPPRACWS